MRIASAALLLLASLLAGCSADEAKPSAIVCTPGPEQQVSLSISENGSVGQGSSQRLVSADFFLLVTFWNRGDAPGDHVHVAVLDARGREVALVQGHRDDQPRTMDVFTVENVPCVDGASYELRQDGKVVPFLPHQVPRLAIS